MLVWTFPFPGVFHSEAKGEIKTKSRTVIDGGVVTALAPQRGDGVLGPANYSRIACL